MAVWSGRWSDGSGPHPQQRGRRYGLLWRKKELSCEARLLDKHLQWASSVGWLGSTLEIRWGALSYIVIRVLLWSIVVSWVGRRQLRWFRQLIKMHPGCLPVEVFWARSTGRRPWGRPRNGWRDLIVLGKSPEEIERDFWLLLDLLDRDGWN